MWRHWGALPHYMHRTGHQRLEVGAVGVHHTCELPGLHCGAANPRWRWRSCLCLLLLLLLAVLLHSAAVKR